MGEVYRARDIVLGCDVALKTMPEEFGHHPQRLARLKREARPPKRKLVWVDRQGRRSAVTTRQQDYDVARLSPDGRRLATSVGVGTDTGPVSLILDIGRDAWTKVAFHGQDVLGGGRVQAGRTESGCSSPRARQRPDSCW